MDSNGESGKYATRSNWLGEVGLDFAKAGILLYVLGLIASSFYYARFSILTLDFTKTQSILVGIYILVLYGAVPVTVLFLIQWLSNRRYFGFVFAGVLTVVDLSLGMAAGKDGIELFCGILFTGAIQLLCFLQIDRLWATIPKGESRVVFALLPPRMKAAGFALAASLQFSLLWFPSLPVYLGGGKPLRVQVFTKTADLPGNRFVDSKNRPKINTAMDSFSLSMLYETDKDVYFLYNLQTGDDLVGYSVMRLKKDEILRIDYNTPKWVRWKGN